MNPNPDKSQRKPLMRIISGDSGTQANPVPPDAILAEDGDVLQAENSPPLLIE